MSLSRVSHGSGGLRDAFRVGAVYDLEHHLVNVDRVSVDGEVVDVPQLRRSLRRVLGHRVHPAKCVRRAVNHCPEQRGRRSERLGQRILAGDGDTALSALTDADGVRDSLVQ